MKSQANALLHVMQGLRKDVQAAYPALKGLAKDFDRLALYCQTRGLGLFTLDLPSLDPALLQGLETGRLVLGGPLSKRVSKKIGVPRLFSGLWLRVFDKSACLRQDVDVNAIAFLRQIFRLGKNIVVECSQSRKQAALENYHAIERAMVVPTLRWDHDTLGECQHGDHRHLGDNLRVSRVHDLFWTAQMRAEPGRVSEILRDNRLLDQCQQVADVIVGSFEFCEPVSYSGDLESEARGIGCRHGSGAVSERIPRWERSQFRFWPDKLEGWFPFDQLGKTAGSPEVRPSVHEGPSRLILVPKTAKGPRIIASEPTSHMWCQQLLRRFMVDQLNRLFGEDFICFHKQELSGELVLGASRDRNLATIDLSDASDRLSCWTVERILRKSPSLLSSLHAARTRYLRDTVSKEMGFLKLRKFASQGTATTFPVQSLVFLCLAIGSCIQGRVTMRKIRKLSSHVRVYGDDIIIPSRGYARLLRVTELLGLKVNRTKSFVNGHFRESCGTDGFMGYDVTPTSPKTVVVDSPASCQAVIDTCNNLYCKGYWHASDHLKSHIPPRIRCGLRIVDQHGAGFSGLISYSGGDESHLRTRWNQSLHRYEVRVWNIRYRTLKRDRGGYSALLDFMSNVHNHEQARVVHEFDCSRKTRDGLLWEPRITPTRDLRCQEVSRSGRSIPSGVGHPSPPSWGNSPNLWRVNPTWCRALGSGDRRF